MNKFIFEKETPFLLKLIRQLHLANDVDTQDK